MAYTPDGTRLVTLSSHAVKVWDADSGRELRTLGPVGGPSRYALAFRPDGRRHASVSADQTIKVWDVSVVNGR